MKALGVVAMWIVLAAVLGSCGGGGGASDPVPAAPGSVALLFVSGHTSWVVGATVPNYLGAADDAGPEIAGYVRSLGFTVTADYFIDDPVGDTSDAGFFDLLDVMDYIQTNLQPTGTKTIVVAHSHGGVWAHEAIRMRPGLSVAALVDLDANSYLWGTVHPFSDPPGGDPRERYDIGRYLVRPEYQGVPAETNGVYDLEDVVFPNVVRNLEIRSGDSFPLALEWYDEAWNIRTDGSGAGISAYVSFTDHSEVHDPSGSTIPHVESWLKGVLRP